MDDGRSGRFWGNNRAIGYGSLCVERLQPAITDLCCFAVEVCGLGILTTTPPSSRDKREVKHSLKRPQIIGRSAACVNLNSVLQSLASKLRYSTDEVNNTRRY